MVKKTVLALVLLSVFVLVVGMPVIAQEDEFVFGLILVGPQNDGGWSQAHYEGGLYVEETIPGAQMLVFPSLNPADAPQDTLLSVVTDMVDQGAELIITTSDTFEEDTDVVAEAFPDVIFINASGDNALTGEAPSNVGNVMGQMEYGKLIAGCAAGIATQTGNIGYLGPLINSETRRFASSAYLGARHCFEQYNENTNEFTFTVTWIGFWFNIPGVTLDPTEETNRFFDGGTDVVISGIDTPNAIEVAGQRAANGDAVLAVPYDYREACAIAPEVCLGTPYFNWGPDYAAIVQDVIDGTWESSWQWSEPDWSDLNNPDTSPVGFIIGDGLTEEQAGFLQEFIDEVSAYATSSIVPESFPLWTGALDYQDGSTLAEAGAYVDPLDVWYLPQLLDGMVGASE